MNNRKVAIGRSAASARVKPNDKWRYIASNASTGGWDGVGMRTTIGVGFGVVMGKGALSWWVWGIRATEGVRLLFCWEAGCDWTESVLVLIVMEMGACIRRQVWMRKGWSGLTVSMVTNSAKTWSRLSCNSQRVCSKEKMVEQVAK